MKAWEDYLSTLSHHLGSEAIHKWLRPISIHRFDAANLFLKATPFQKAWYEEHVIPLKVPFLNNNQRPIRIHWETEARTPSEKPTSPSMRILANPLDPDFTLDTFIPLKTNEMGWKMAQELVFKEALFNPVVYFGPSGSGKTHLLMAISHALKAQNKNVFYVTMDSFTDHVVNAIRLGLMQDFRKAYRDIDVLIVDNVHQLARKNATQEEFFHTFNTLHTMGKQIILSSESAPSHLQEIEPRLISRFEWGIAIPLSIPESLKAILEQKAKLLNLQLPSDLPDFLIKRFSKSPKSAIKALNALALRTECVINCQHAETLLKDLLATETDAALTHEKILSRVAKEFGIRAEDLTGKSQAREFAQPRQVSMYFCRKHLQLPYQAIGRLFGRDHSTVMTSIRQVEKGVSEKQPPYFDAVLRISKDF